MDPTTSNPESVKTASDIFAAGLSDQIDPAKVERIIQIQRETLSRFEKTNEMLSNCCALSSNRLEAVKREFAWYTQMILDMKKDLDSIFRRVRIFKQTLGQLYPAEFAAALENTEAQSSATNSESEEKTERQEKQT